MSAAVNFSMLIMSESKTIKPKALKSNPLTSETSKRRSSTSLLFNLHFILLFISTWCLLFYFAPSPLDQLLDYAVFSVLGIIGAIFANSTGAGGGVIFIPMFNQLHFSEQQALATSFAIQCFGMTAGAFTWLNHYRQHKSHLRVWRGFKTIIALASTCSILGLSLVYYAHFSSPSSLHYAFSWFSFILGGALLAVLRFTQPERERSTLSNIDIVALIIISFIGGVITAWLSVGIGELLAVYLILRRFDVTMAVAIAVVVSAMSVWFAIWQHTFVNFAVYWQVVLFAGPSAVLGGIFARTLVTHLSARKLKLFFALWLLISALVSF